MALNDGNVEIALGDGRVSLSCTLHAATRISKHFGGFQQAINAVTSGQLDAITAVVRFGMGGGGAADVQGLDEAVFRAGVLKLTAPCTEYLLLLANGGKPLSQETDAQKKRDLDAA